MGLTFNGLGQALGLRPNMFELGVRLLNFRRKMDFNISFLGYSFDVVERLQSD